MIRWLLVVVSASLVACAASTPRSDWTRAYELANERYRFNWLNDGQQFRDRAHGRWE